VPRLFINSYLVPMGVGVEKEELVTWLTRKEDYLASRPSVSTSCRIRDEISLGMERLAARQLLSTLENDQPIRFFERYDDAVEARYGPTTEFKVTANGWLDGVTFRRGQRQGESYSFSGQDVHELYRSDLDSTSEWQIHRYGRAGGIKILPDGLSKGDAVAEYSSDDARDHLASAFLTLPLRNGVVFFSSWVRPRGNSEVPDLSLQQSDYSPLATARPVATRPGGWVLLAGWADVSQPQTVRIVMISKPKTVCLLDKALLTEFPSHASDQPAQQHGP
jgi:hypothetical protein